jgi:hypothetical protein
MPGLTGETEFQIYPTEIRSKNVSITQSPEGISREIERDREAAYAKVAADTFLAACRERVKARQRYPESVTFSWLDGEFAWENETDLRYVDVVKSKNGFGNVVPVRFVCTASLRKKEAPVRVVFLD